MSELRSCSMCGKKLEWIDNNYGGLVPACTNRQCENYEFPLYENGLFEDDEDAEIAALRQSLAEHDAEIERLREAQRWIPVSERLPEIGVWVLIRRVDGAKGMWRRFESFEPGWQNETGVAFSLRRVTHWMPLPESPQEAEGN